MGFLNDLLELNDDGGCDNLKKINHKRALFSIVLKISAALFTCSAPQHCRNVSQVCCLCLNIALKWWFFFLQKPFLTHPNSNHVLFIVNMQSNKQFKGLSFINQRGAGPHCKVPR